MTYSWLRPGFFLAMIGLIWLTRRPPRAAGAPADAGGAH